jgi:E3 ubiquitin-protein ligase SHPRH
MSPQKQTSRQGPCFGHRAQDLASNGAILGLPDELIEYVSRTYEPEPPRKRQKVAQESNFDKPDRVEPQDANWDSPNELDYVVVKESTWEVKCGSSKLSEIETPLEKANINLHVPFRSNYISIRDDEKADIFKAQLPRNKESLEDVRLALEIHQASHKSHLWAKYQGKMWTEFGVILLQHDGIDHVKMVFTIKWNLTHLPQHIPAVSKKPPPIQKALEAYFPDPNVTMADTWTPHDFYQSAHTPSTVDEVAASSNIDIKSELYPFQKRAVRWLLQKEGVDWTGTDVRPRDLQDIEDGSLPPTFVKAKDARGRTFFLSSLYGCAALDIQPFQKLRLNGGILAEEMGLGKTLEMISLITLHRRPQEASMVFDPYTVTSVRPTGATLIVCPPTLVQQWIAEVKRHSDLKIMHYEGISKSQNEMSSEQLLDNLASSDIVISTYSVLAAEIHFTALNPEKSLRRQPKYRRPESPLMKFSWWRICMDEAQMVESWVSKAAVVARIVPRINAWCVTGTPVRKGVDDLLGLLVFLRVEPFVGKKHIWGSLISSHKTEFRRLFAHLALRHNKKTVRNELKLPAQKRYVVTMPFTPVEEEHYQELFNEMCDQLKLDVGGAPLTDNWDPDLAAEHMRRW